MSEELDLITVLFALLGIGIAFKSDIIRAYKNRKIAKEKKILIKHQMMMIIHMILVQVSILEILEILTRKKSLKRI